ncbi:MULTISPECIES: hypothetical protein [unclassified Microcoleus]
MKVTRILLVRAIAPTAAVETQSKSAIATWSKDYVFAQILIPRTAYQNYT